MLRKQQIYNINRFVKTLFVCRKFQRNSKMSNISIMLKQLKIQSCSELFSTK